MALAGRTARLSCRSAALVVVLLTPCAALAQVSEADRAAIARLGQSRGVAQADLAPLVDEVSRAGERGLPQQPLLNKVKEGLAKGHTAVQVLAVVRDLAGHLDSARGLLGPAVSDAARTRATVMLAEALLKGVTRPEFERLRELAETGGAPTRSEGLAVGAQFWALLKEGGFSDSVLPVVAEAVRQEYRAADVATLAREMVVQRADLATADRLDGIRDAVRRGERPERVLPPRDARPVRPQRPERTERPERPERPAR